MQLWNVHMLAVTRRQKFSFKSEHAPQSCKLQASWRLTMQTANRSNLRVTKVISDWFQPTEKHSATDLGTYIVFLLLLAVYGSYDLQLSSNVWATSHEKLLLGNQRQELRNITTTPFGFLRIQPVLHIEISPQAFRAGEIWWSSHCVSVTSPDAGIRKEEEEEPVNIVRFNWMCLEESLVLKTVKLWVGTYRGNWKTHTRLYINSFHFPWSHTTGVIKRQHNTKVINDAVCLLFNL